MTENENIPPLFERSESLPPSPLRDLASIAALAHGYAVKAEGGTATWIDLGTLTSHCQVLADDLYAMADGRPEVVVLCGSTKFPDAFAAANKRLGLEGKIVLSVSMFGHAGDLTEEECTIGHPTKDGLDELHKRKIDLADRVLVLNVNGYIGASTRSEIEYAEWFDKPIDYLEPDMQRADALVGADPSHSEASPTATCLSGPTNAIGPEGID